MGTAYSMPQSNTGVTTFHRIDERNYLEMVSNRRNAAALRKQSDKRPILREYDRCKKPGERGALLRDERIYSSMVTGWRKQLARVDQATPAVRCDPKISPATAQKRRDEQLRSPDSPGN